MTILFQPPNHIGIGHISRLAAIALEVRELDRAARTPFAVEGSGDALLEALELPYVSLPTTHVLYKTAHWQAWRQEERYALMLEISRAILKSLEPRVVVFDSFPSRAFAQAARESGIPQALVLRGMKHASQHLGSFREMARDVKAVLIPDDPQENDLPEEWRAKAVFVGRIARTVRTRERSNAATRILVTGGGGGGAGVAEFYNLAMEAAALVEGAICELVTGPLFQEWRQLRPAGGARLVPFVADLPGEMAAADLVIASAGYNTIAELEQAGTRAICVPVKCMYDDQALRAEDHARRHSHFRVFLGDNAEQLRALIGESMAGAAGPGPVAPPPGAREAARRILEIAETAK